MEEERVRPLAGRLPAGHVDSLEHLSPELAAGALVDLFLRTGSAQARVNNPDEVRRLIRLACRRSGTKVRTLGAHGVVVVHDEERHDAFLATEAGAAYTVEMNRRIMSALESWAPAPSPPLRLLPSDVRDD